MDSDKPLLVEPSAPSRDPAGNNSSQPARPPPPAGPMDPAIEAGAPTAEKVSLVLVAEPRALAWARHIVHFLQTGELPGDQDEAEKVARRASMYQFFDDTLYRKGPMV